MRKKVLSILLIVTIIIQLSVPVGFLIYKAVEINLVKEKGELYTFSTYSPIFRKNRLYLRLDIFGPTRQYVVFSKDAEGNTFIEHSETKPDTDTYIDRYSNGYQTSDFSVEFPEISFRTGYYKNLDYLYFVKKMSYASYQDNPPENTVYYEDITAQVYIYKGRIYVNEIYIDGVDSATFLEKLNNTK